MTSRLLCAVLASPPQTSGVRTLNALVRVAGLLGCEDVHVVNLLDVPTSDTGEMASAGREAEAWLGSRSKLREGLEHTDVLLAAWGVSDLIGPAREHRRDQVRWVVAEAMRTGHDVAWSVGPDPRHPSRWHQYVADRHGRTPTGLTFEERLRVALVQTQTAALLER